MTNAALLGLRGAGILCYKIYTSCDFSILDHGRSVEKQTYSKHFTTTFVFGLVPNTLKLLGLGNLGTSLTFFSPKKLITLPNLSANVTILCEINGTEWCFVN